MSFNQISMKYSRDHDCRASHVHYPSKNRNIPCLVKRLVSPNFRRMTAFSPSQATLTAEFTVSVEMSPKRIWWILNRQAERAASCSRFPSSFITSSRRNMT